MIKYPILFFFLFFTGALTAQQLKLISLGNPSSIRGLSAVSDSVIWVSGSGGTVGLSQNAGNTWKWITVPHYEKTEFRDIEAFSDSEAVIMGITEPAVILKTKDGGRTWTKSFEDSSKATFLDAMDFSGDKGILLGDPVNNRVFLAATKNRGDSWSIAGMQLPKTESGEAFFAASGTNIRWLPDGHFLFVSGGKKAALYVDSTGRFPLLLSQGKESTGANSIAINPADPNQAFITGGDFMRDTITEGNALNIRLHPFHQQPPQKPPRGYRSCVEYITNRILVSCGTSGVDISEDSGKNWRFISAKSFHVCRKAKSGNRIYLAGAHGAIACLVWP